MRGLICKDLRLMLVQKNFFIMLAFVAFVCMAALDDPAFVVMNVTLIFTSFLLATMSYDEFDNGYPFLFTLPISRKLYVQEKYVLGMAGGGIAWLLSTLLAGIAFFLTQGGLPPLSWFVLPFAALPMLVLLIALMIPFKLKFGGENGRLAMLLAIAAVCAIFGAALGLMQSMGISVQTITAVLPAMSMALSALLILVICALIVAISCGISMHIMEHREF